jgi:hypothetical protein
LEKKGSVPTKRAPGRSCEGRVNLAAGAGVNDLDLQTDGASSRFHVSQCGFLSRSIGRIDEHGNTREAGYQLTQELQALCRQLRIEKINPCQIAARPGQAGDQAKPDRVFGGGEDDGDGRGCRFGCQHRSVTSGRGDHCDLSANQFGRERRKPVDLILRKAVFDRHVLALDIASVF